jgi:YHS domain-containing protein/ElaB/YqjD/DUF883 family membrane-anchored ribosome-binding protein
MAKDPVCNLEVDEKTIWQSTYQNKTYYFSSAECKADFDRDPARYSAGATSKMAEAGGALHEQWAKRSSRARTKLESMISDKKSKAAEQIVSLSNAFRSVSQQLKDQQQETIARYADSAALRVDRFSGYLQQTDAKQIIREAEDFVRRRPGLVIGSAFAAGFFMARFLKSSKAVST